VPSQEPRVTCKNGSHITPVVTCEPFWHITPRGDVQNLGNNDGGRGGTRVGHGPPTPPKIRKKKIISKKNKK
jgi:hypothetical protein